MGAGLGTGAPGELDLGGEDEPLDLGGEDEPLDLGGEEEPPEEVGGGEDDVLLAAPGNRDDGYVTKGSNGKVYHPVASDKRKLGAAHRSTKGSWSDETARSTKRNVWKAPSLIGLEEQEESNYDNEEKLLSESTVQVRELIMELEKSTNGEKTQ